MSFAKVYYYYFYFRNHLNDLENIPAFILVGTFYVLTRPRLSTALWHFRVFFFSRLLHTLAYQAAFPQPSRALAYIAGLASVLSMCYSVIRATY